jgi:hypothetical protein
MKYYRLAFLALLAPSVASAHIGILGPVLANKTNQKITFAINHGCTAPAPSGAKLDTLSVRVDIPTVGIDRTTVRAMSSDLSNSPVVDRTGTDPGATVNFVKWTRDPANLQNGDVWYYEVTIKVKTLDVPFTKIPFVITQVCRPQGGNPDGSQDVTVVWEGPSSNAEPSPQLLVVPAHATGWHKFTLTTAVAAADFGTYFGDAQIVWKGTSAFSPNMSVKDLIAVTPGVSPLTADLASGDEIWVKY